MPNFTGMRLTRLGMELLGLTGAGAVLDFTRVAVGSGLWSEAQQSAPAELTGLIREEMSLDIGSIAPTSVPETDEAAGSYTIFTMLTNSGLESGFTLRELGIFATHPSRGEILYAVVYSGDDQYDYIPQLPAGAAPLEKQFRIDVVTGNAKEITIKQSPVLLATHDDISEHDVNPEAHPDLLARLATGTPEILNPADGATNIGETPIITAREFVPVFANTEHQASQWQVDLLSGNFSNPVFDSGPSSVALNSFELPAGYLQVSTIYKVRTRRRLNTGQWSPWSEPKTFMTKDIFNYVERPANAEPISGATNVGECPTLKSSPFAVVGDEPDTHAATQFRIRQGDTILHLSPELGAVLEYLIPAGLLQVSSDYVFECRHKGAVLGWSDWSTATAFRTASAFITGDEAVYPSSWVGHDDASAAGVALADDAALRSNGIDQGEGEADWAEYSVRAKVRSEGLNIMSNSSAQKLYTDTAIVGVTVDVSTELGSVKKAPVSGKDSTNVLDIFGDKSCVDCFPFNEGSPLGLADGCSAPTSLVEIDGKWGGGAHIPECHGHAINPAATVSFRGTTAINTNNFAFSLWSKDKNWLHIMFRQSFSVTSADISRLIGFGGSNKIIYLGQNSTAYVTDAQYNYINSKIMDGKYHHWCITAGGVNGNNVRKLYIDSELIHSVTLPGYSNLVFLGMFHYTQYVDQIRVFNRGISADEVQLLKNERLFEIDTSAAGYTEPPTRAHIIPKLTAATGPAGAAFAQADFAEIDIENATLGTDSDPDRPDFILLESTKQTPAEPFRRVALGVSGLSKDSECRVAETQIDTWKQGA
ncbi:hypothetical protein [Desulfovibrio gilichinskyi]|uniref:Concanavalin A-like lectin/glucanases superfamily protein n=1 Tax=Desulfovibrio gilichinskyi TaxID=1519643 RepID=A0A1X7CHG6_9BACT|nr:hypothetical protein [Desulfovibrio gilichinskyi]SME96379.1 hypothetical protein SAMN06295933_0882 [Desulfovibrio gilichinskyi]